MMITVSRMPKLSIPRSQVVKLVYAFLTILTDVTSNVVADDAANLPSYCPLWNAAFCKPSSASSVFNGVATADLAVDGDENTEYLGQSCFHSESQSDNWWLVDLMDDYLVHKVIVTNRGDNTNGVHTMGTAIDLYLTDPRLDPSFPTNTNGINCASIDVAFPVTKSFDCATPSYARYVKLWMAATYMLSFCEVQVIVSKRRDGPDCNRTRSKLFDIVNDATVQNQEVLDSVFLNTRDACLHLCVQKSGLCTGFQWTEITRECRLLIVNLYENVQVTATIGTDFYAEPLKVCG